MVGESGSGKSVTSLSIMGLLQAPGHVAGGSITFDGKDLLSASEREMEAVRGGEISMIFQEPMTSLNPVYRVGDQIVEAIRTHMDLSRREAWARAVEMLRVVGIPSPEERARDYPHQMSGGMRQRVMIAMALSCDPSLLIADEPTTALDVTIQAQILDLIYKLRDEFDMAVMLITHDLGVVSEVADRVVVMYCGQVVEEAEKYELFEHPLHPYTTGLLRSNPPLGGRVGRAPVHDPGNGAQPARHAGRLPVLRSLRALLRALPLRAPAAQGRAGDPAGACGASSTTTRATFPRRSRPPIEPRSSAVRRMEWKKGRDEGERLR